MIKKQKSKIVSNAQKTENNKNYSSHIVDNNKVIVQIPKNEIEGSLSSILTMGIMFAFHEMGIKGIDITVRENKNNYEIVVEK